MKERRYGRRGERERGREIPRERERGGERGGSAEWHRLYSTELRLADSIFKNENHARIQDYIFTQIRIVNRQYQNGLLACVRERRDESGGERGDERRDERREGR